VIRFIEVRPAGGVVTGEAAVTRAAEWLADGGLLAHPTSTVYGIGGAAGPRTDAEVNRVKGRPADQPLIHVAADVATLREKLPRLDWPTGVDALAAEFWPGALTLVVPEQPGRDGGDADVAVRVEPQAELRAVLTRWGGIMTSTSLNASGEAPATSGDEALAILGSLPRTTARIALLDVGELQAANASTMVKLREGRPELLREGDISFDRVLDALGSGREGSDVEG
jgi:L-threonylcarbamoyladenylate synthase